MTPILLALGSTEKTASAIFAGALAELTAAGLRNARLSRIFHTAPVNCVPGTPEFANAVATGEWPGDARSLLRTAQRIEVESGRPPVHRSDEARALDIDLILFGEERIAEADLVVPHPRALEREFVLLPLRELAPELETVLRRLSR